MAQAEKDKMWVRWWDWADRLSIGRFDGFTFDGGIKREMGDVADAVMCELPYMLLELEELQKFKLDVYISPVPPISMIPAMTVTPYPGWKIVVDSNGVMRHVKK